MISLLSCNTSSLIFKFIVLLGILISIISPSSTNAIAPPSAASGEICPMLKPEVPPENLPSVNKAQTFPSPLPFRCAVGYSISCIPGPPFGPS